MATHAGPANDEEGEYSYPRFTDGSRDTIQNELLYAKDFVFAVHRTDMSGAERHANWRVGEPEARGRGYQPARGFSYAGLRAEDHPVAGERLASRRT